MLFGGPVANRHDLDNSRGAVGVRLQGRAIHIRRVDPFAGKQESVRSLGSDAKASLNDAMSLLPAVSVKAREKLSMSPAEMPAST